MLMLMLSVQPAHQHNALFLWLLAQRVEHRRHRRRLSRLHDHILTPAVVPIHLSLAKMPSGLNP